MKSAQPTEIMLVEKIVITEMSMHNEKSLDGLEENLIRIFLPSDINNKHQYSTNVRLQNQKSLKSYLSHWKVHVQNQYE